MSSEDTLVYFSFFEGDWTNCWRPDVHCSDASKKDGLFRRARHMSLSSSVMIVLRNVLASAVWQAIGVPRSTLSNIGGLLC